MTEKYQDKIGCFLQIPNVGRGQLKYVGPVEGKQGTFVGVDLLANIGKNDGTYMGKRYFETEYPQSGLFIQLQKVARLLEQSSDVPLSNTTTAAGNVSTQSNRLSIMTNASNIEYLGGHNLNKPRNRTSSVVYRSPTPRMTNTRATSMMSRRTLTSDQSDLLSDSMDVEIQGVTDSEIIADDIDGDVEMDDKHGILNEAGNILDSATQFKPSSSISYEAKIKEQKDEIQHYKRLLDDQRIVLEEIQPAIDDYEEKLRFLEAENNRLQKALQSERESQLKKKQYFETEHEQLLSVVDELHKEIKDNEERMLRQKRRQTVIMEDASHLVELESLRSENDALREQIQTLKSLHDNQMRETNADWERKYESLKLQHDVLTKENNDLSHELSDLKRKYHDISRNVPVDSKSEIAGYQSEVAILKRELEEASSLISLRTISNSRTPRELEIENTKFGDSLPLYDGKKKDPAAGRLLWCALCEKDGHSAFECTEVAF